MKTRLKFIAASMLALSVATAGGAMADNKTIATVVKIAGVGWFDRMEKGVDAFAAANADINAFQQGPGQADAAQQAQIIEDLIAQNVDAIGVVPLSAETLEAVLKKARERGIVVVAHEGATLENIDYDVEAFDNEAYGVHLMDALAERMNGKGDYATFVGALTNVTHNIWVDAAVAHQRQKYPEMNWLGEKYVSDEDAQTAYRKTQEILVTHPSVRGFLGSSSNDVVGIGQAIDEAGLNDATEVVGTSIVSMAGSGLENGSIDMIAAWDPKDAGLAINEIAARVMRGETIAQGDDLGIPGYESVTVDGKVVTGSAWIDMTADNMGDYDF
ncbi:substrate-binding domain-containing protein [Nitratireductor sp. StC3]|uniref:substrate-binding domain-containing protein n=1 Tax=Nitratireductor sp. StC3 TaxID=2126741 RepID=UPI000D0CCFEA|nr:substrate-binding domain-containing protein [Nitratireductor sp. StC3]PSM16791.1 LacI family transcriptional regulator [Nitratireductor sp. StC3]